MISLLVWSLTLVMIPIAHALKVENSGIVEILTWENNGI
jgi:hypothetical protein